MRINDITICAIDIISIFVVLFIIAFMAIKYDANKGIGSQDYIKIIRFLESNVNADRKYKSFDYTAIIIDKKIKFYRYKQGKSLILHIFNNITEIEQSSIINSKDTYILYEREKTENLANIIRLFASKGITLGVARVSW